MMKSKRGRPRKSGLPSPDYSVTLYIPSTIDLTGLLKIQNKYKKLHHYASFLDLLGEKYAQIKALKADGYIRLQCKKLQDLLTSGEAKMITSDLESWGIIDIDHHYTPPGGEKKAESKGYRLARAYRNCNWIPITVRNKSLFDKHQGSRVQQVGLIDSSLTLSFLLCQFKRIRVDIEGARSLRDYQLADLSHLPSYSDSEVQQTESFNHNLPHPFHLPTPYDICFSEIHKEAFDGLSNFHEASLGIRPYIFQRDQSVHRLHTNLTSLKRELRQFLYLDTGEELVCVDVGECHPFLFAAMLNIEANQRWDGVLPEDVLLYISLTQKRGFYDYVIAECRARGLQVGDRGQFKDHLFSSVFYCKVYWMEHSENLCSQVFKAIFPNVWEVIREKKQYGHGALSIEMLQQEAFIMIDSVCEQIAALHDPDFFCAAIYDEIITTHDRVDQVMQMMLNAFKQHYRLEPIVKRKGFSRPQLLKLQTEAI